MRAALAAAAITAMVLLAVIVEKDKEARERGHLAIEQWITERSAQ